MVTSGTQASGWEDCGLGLQQPWPSSCRKSGAPGHGRRAPGLLRLAHSPGQAFGGFSSVCKALERRNQHGVDICNEPVTLVKNSNIPQCLHSKLAKAKGYWDGSMQESCLHTKFHVRVHQCSLGLTAHLWVLNFQGRYALWSEALQYCICSNVIYLIRVTKIVLGRRYKL